MFCCFLSAYKFFFEYLICCICLVNSFVNFVDLVFFRESYKNKGIVLCFYDSFWESFPELILLRMLKLAKL